MPGDMPAPHSLSLLLPLLYVLMSGATEFSREVLAEREALHHLSTPSGTKIGRARTANELAAGVDSSKFSGGEKEKLAAAKYFAQQEEEWIAGEV